jgi:hypothetical protein
MRVKDVKRTVVAAIEAHAKWWRTFATNTAGLTTVDEYLTAWGVGEAARKRWASAFGRRVAKIFRAVRGTEPLKAWAGYGEGRSRKVFAYADDAQMFAAWTDYAHKIKEG